MSRAAQISRFFFVLVFGVGGANHFVAPAFYVGMMPPFLPAHEALVALSGVTELATAALLLLPRTRALGALSVAAHLVVFLLVHGFMVARPELWPDIPAAALWVRLVVQFFAIALALWLARALRASQPAQPVAPSSTKPQ